MNAPPDTPAGRGPMASLRPLLTLAAMAVLAIAALSKLSDLPRFAAALRTWQTVPAWGVGPLTAIVPALELAAAGWFLGLGGRAPRVAALTMVLAWSGAYVVETVGFGAPACGCMGRIADWQVLRDEAPWVLGRNAVLALLLACGGDLRRPVAARRGPAPAPAGPRGFTLIEVLLTLCLITILIALAVPSLRGVRAQAKSARALADLHTHGTMLGAYSADHREMFPCIADPRATHTLIPLDGEPLLLAYFDMRIYWWAGLGPTYYGQTFSPTFFAPSATSEPRGEPYWYSLACVARPEYWNPETRTQDGQIGGVRLSEVLYPSRKGIFINWAEPLAGRAYSGGEIARAVEAAFADGSASRHASNSFLPPIASGEGPFGWPRVRLHVGLPVVHTLNGVRGRDLP